MLRKSFPQERTSLHLVKNWTMLLAIAVLTSPRPSFPIDRLETVDRWRSSRGVKIEVERNPKRVWEGRGCMKLTFKVDLKREPPWWESVWREGFDLPLPREVRFWVFPQHPAICVMVQEGRGKTAFFQVKGLKVGEWNLVRLPLDMATIWGKKPKSLKGLKFSVHPGMGFSRSGEFTYLVDKMEAVYNWALCPSVGCRVQGRHSLVLLPEAPKREGLTLDKTSFTNGERVTIKVRLPRKVDDIRVRFILSSQREKFVFDRRFRGREAKVGGAQLELWGDAFPEGNYKVEAQVELPNGRGLPLGSTRLRKVNPPERWKELRRKAKELGRKTDKLKGLLREAGRKGVRAPYVKAALAWMRRYLREAENVKVENGKVWWLMGWDLRKQPNPYPVDFSQAGLWEKWEGDLRFLSRLCDWTERRLQRLLAHPEEGSLVPEPDLRHVTIKGGNFWVDEKPIVFAGFQGGWGLREVLLELGDFGFNAVNPIWLEWVIAPGSKKGLDRERISKIQREELFRHNLAVLLPIHFNPPGWAYEEYPDLRGWGPLLPRSYPKLCGGGFMRFALEAPSARRLVRTWHEAIIPVLKKLPNLRLYDLHIEFSYHSQTKIYLEKFRHFLKQRYRSVEALNRMWGTNYRDFREVPFPFEQEFAFPDEASLRRFCVSGFKRRPENKVVWKDWLEFHQEQVADWFRWMTRSVKRLDPQGLVTFRPVMNIHWIPEQGVDWEEFAHFLDVLGGNFYVFPPGHTLGLPVFDSPVSATGINLDFLHSLAPEKPLGSYAFHPYQTPPRALWRRAPEGYAYALLWHCFLHGMRFCTFWLWEMGWPYRGAPEVNCSAFPEVAWDISRASLDLRRLAEFVCQFPPEVKQVGLLFPRVSTYLDKNTFAKVSKVYSALDFIGVPVEFVTERMIERGALKRLKVLVVPNSPYLPEGSFRKVLGFVRNGGTLVLVGKEALKFDERGKARNLSSLQFGRVRRLGMWNLSPQELAERLGRLLETCGLLPPIKVSTLDGSVPWGVEWRAKKVGNGFLIYLLNLGLDEARLMLHLPLGKWGVKNLISSKREELKLRLTPFEVSLLEVVREK